MGSGGIDHMPALDPLAVVQFHMGGAAARNPDAGGVGVQKFGACRPCAALHGLQQCMGVEPAFRAATEGAERDALGVDPGKAGRQLVRFQQCRSGTLRLLDREIGFKHPAPRLACKQQITGFVQA